MSDEKTPPSELTLDDLRAAERPRAMGAGRLIFERPAMLSNAAFRGLNRIGAFSYGNAHSSFNNADVGRFTSIAHRVLIGPSEHPVDWLSSHGFVYNDRGVFRDLPAYETILSKETYPRQKLRTRIGNDVWLAANVFVRRGVTIGDGAIAAAGAVIVRDVPPYAMVGGTPAKIIKMRFKEKLIERFLKFGWWNYVLDQKVLPNIRYSQAEAALNQIEEAAAAGWLRPLAPPVFEIRNGYEVSRLKTTLAAS